jgi:Tfp pilus assembly protein PilN
VASANPNTVTALPRLSNALNKLIDSLPTGEWLKKPTTVQNAGRKGWTVTLTYQWAPQWSIIYGGTFTGLDA